MACMSSTLAVDEEFSLTGEWRPGDGSVGESSTGSGGAGAWNTVPSGRLTVQLSGIMSCTGTCCCS